MKHTPSAFTLRPAPILKTRFAFLAALSVASVLLARSAEDLSAREAVLDLNGRKVVVKTLEALPCVENDYSRRFRFDTFANPKLKELRERYKLEAVVAPGQNEFEKQVLLLDWAHHQFKKFGRPSTSARGALEILRALESGQTFFCSQYAQLFVSAAASLGWVDRELALRRHQGQARDGSSEHSSTEIWSNQYRKWVMLDPTANLHVEKEGVPLSAYEIRQEWFGRGGKDLVFVVGKEQERYRKADLPIFLQRFEGFGDLTVPADEFDKYGFIGYVPNTNLMDEGEDYGRMFIVKDHLCEGTRWHQRDVPQDPATEPYFPLGQASVSLAAQAANIRVSLKTLTPNFSEYQARIDGGAWRPCEQVLLWPLHDGPNRLEVRTVNQFKVEGPVSVVEVIAPKGSLPRAD